MQLLIWELWNPSRSLPFWLSTYLMFMCWASWWVVSVFYSFNGSTLREKHRMDDTELMRRCVAGPSVVKFHVEIIMLLCNMKLLNYNGITLYLFSGMTYTIFSKRSVIVTVQGEMLNSASSVNWVAVVPKLNTSCTDSESCMFYGRGFCSYREP